MMILRKLMILLVVLVSCSFVVGQVFADTLVLKDGQRIQGTFVGRTADGVNFEVGGQVMEFKNTNVKTVELGVAPAPAEAPAQPPVEASPPAPAEAAPTAASGKVTVPAGTKIVVRTNEPIDSRQHKAGHKFTAKLEADLVAEGVVVAPRGSNVYGQLVAAQKSRRLAGKSEMTITFTDLMVNNQMKPISTSQVQAVTENTAKKTVGTTARAAAVGGLIDGKSGARTGAKVGVGVSVLTSGNQINIPAGTMLEISLAAPFTP
jgi:hypothetical protein